jgi:hypothetical protein
MAATQPRIQVMVDATTHRVVKRLSKAARLSMSRICADVIEQAAPVLARSVKMLEAAAQLSEEAKVQLRLDIAKEERIARTAYGNAMGALAETEVAIRKAAGRAPGGGEARARGRPAAKPTGRHRRRTKTPG